MSRHFIPGTGNKIIAHCLQLLFSTHGPSVFEIKGAPCTLCACFGGWVHIFWNLCTRWVHTFSKFSICLYINEHIEILPGAWGFLLMHPAGAQNKSLISNTDLVTSKMCQF